MQTGFYRSIVFAWCWQKISLSKCVMDVKIFLYFRAHVFIDFYVWFCVSLDDGQAVYCTLITLSTGGERALQKLWFSLFIIKKKHSFLPICLFLCLSILLISSPLFCVTKLCNIQHMVENLFFSFFYSWIFELKQTIQISFNWNSCNYIKCHFLLYF